jgi:hypothetical protein
VLASGEQPLLVEELSMLVRDVAMVDEVRYYYYCMQSQTLNSKDNQSNIQRIAALHFVQDVV